MSLQSSEILIAFSSRFILGEVLFHFADELGRKFTPYLEVVAVK